MTCLPGAGLVQLLNETTYVKSTRKRICVYLSLGVWSQGVRKKICHKCERCNMTIDFFCVFVQGTMMELRLSFDTPTCE